MKTKSVFVNDKVVLLREYDQLKQVGDTFEVANFTDKMVVLRNAKTKVAVCALPTADFFEYFEKQEDVGFKFTPWSTLIDATTGGVLGTYRTNHKKVQVMLPIEYKGSYIRAEASCNKGDNFDLWFGIRLAYARAKVKAYEKIIFPEQAEEYKRSRSDYKQTKNAIKNMMASLEQPKEQEDTEG